MANSFENFLGAFGGDDELVALAAAHHGVAVHKDGVYDPLKPGDYNHRIPRSSELVRMNREKKVFVACMDYRFWPAFCKKFGVNHERPRHPIVAIAGGGAQPERDRQKVLVTFLSELVKINPSLVINLFAHDGVCGGADWMTDGAMKQLYLTNPRGETEQMRGYLQQTVRALYEAGVSPGQIMPWLAHLENNGEVNFLRQQLV